MITYTITDTARQVAKIANTYKIRKHTKGGNYTGLEAEGAYENGTLGELYFYKLLKDNGIRSTYDFNLTGNADRGDFMLYHANKPVMLDVKTACQAFHRMIMIALAQHDKYQYQIYAGVKLNGDKCEIWGFNRGTENTFIEDYGTPSYCRRLDELRDIAVILERADKGTTTVAMRGSEYKPITVEHATFINSWFDNPL